MGPISTHSDTNASSVSSKTSQRSWLRRWGGKLAAPLVLGALTIYAVNEYLSSHATQNTNDQPVGMIERVVAVGDLKAHTKISMEHLALRDFPQTWVSPDSVGPDEIDEIIGMQLNEDVATGMPFLLSMMKRPQPNEFLDQLEPGRRAFTLPMNRISSATRMLQPGEMIDLYVTFDHKGRRITSLLTRKVRVLNVTRDDLDQTGQKSEMLTLDVSPQQAAKLIAAQQDGVLTAVQMPEQASKQHNRSSSVGHQDQTHDFSMPVTDHLAGYAGVESSFEQLQVPEIIYGDGESAEASLNP